MDVIYYGAKGLKLNPGTFKKNLSFYTEDGKYNDVQERLDKLYDDIESTKTSIEEGETRPYNIKQKKISSDFVQSGFVRQKWVLYRLMRSIIVKDWKHLKTNRFQIVTSTKRSSF